LEWQKSAKAQATGLELTGHSNRPITGADLAPSPAVSDGRPSHPAAARKRLARAERFQRGQRGGAWRI